MAQVKNTSACAEETDTKKETGVKVGGKRSRSKRAIKKPSVLDVTPKWNVQEKHKLLEGIKRHGADEYALIAAHVKSKTAEDVEAYIEHLRRNETRPQAKKRRGKRSPIEAWTELITEMVFNEPYDYSKEVSKVFSLIARNEHLEPSGVPRLRWQKIYQFISDLLEDKAEIQELSDIESHIVYDMLDQLGDLIHSSDTDTQTRMLIRKYALLNSETNDATEEGKIHRNRCLQKALTNDFDYNSTDPYVPLQTDHAQEEESSIKASASSLSLKNDKIKASASSLYLSEMPENSEASGSGEVSCKMSLSQTEVREQTNDTNTAADSRKSTYSNVTPYTFEFKKPPYFTLNPLCIPTNLLPFKPKIEYC